MQKLKRPRAASDTPTVYTQAARRWVVLIASGNSGRGLKPGRELLGALGNSCAVTQNIAEPAGQLLPGAPQPCLERVARNAERLGRFVRGQAFEFAQLKGVAQQRR